MSRLPEGRGASLRRPSWAARAPTYVVLAALSALPAIAQSPAAQPATARRVIRPEGAPADRPYSPGVLVDKTLYISGQLGLPGSGSAPAEMKAQAQQAMDGIGAVLKAAGLGFEHLVKCHVYLANMDDYAAMNAVYGSYFKDRVPARTTVQATGLPANAGIEIACIGYADLARISVVRPPDGSLPAPLGPYSPAVRAGDTLYVSGMGGQNPATKTVGEAVEAQVAQTVTNVTTTLKAAGLGPDAVVGIMGYATRPDEAKAVADALGAGSADRPAGLVVVPRLPGPIRAELTFVAAWPNQSRERLAGAPRVMRAGNTAYVAAQPAQAAGSDVEGELRAAFAELRTLLRGVRLETRDVALVTVYLSDIADLPRLNAVFKDTFPNDPPARVTIQVQPQGKERVRIGAVAAM